MPAPSSSRPLRILQVVDTLDSGGMEQQLIALANRLQGPELAFEFCCLRHAGVLAPKLRQDIPLHTLLKPEGFKLKAAWQLRQLLRRGGFDLVHTHNPGPLIYAAIATLGGLSAPILHGEHSQLNAAELTPKRKRQRQRLYRVCKAVHTVSYGQREELLKLGLRHPRLIALQNGVDTARFRPAASAGEKAHERQRAGLPHDAVVLGIFARFGAYKRHLELVEAFLNVAPSHPKAYLLMVGDGGPQKEAVLARIQGAGALAGQILHVGFQNDPAPWYRMLDALVVPSENEGLSNVTLEAMASGVPVLSNDICGAREILGENEGGWITDLSTVEKLAAALRRLLDTTEEGLRATGRQGVERVSRAFSWEGMGRAYAETFRACV